MTTSRAKLEAETGKLFGNLWPQFDDRLFEESVALFGRRLALAHFDPAFFAGKTCLDAGCGGGRNAIAMARLGAAEVHGVDLGEQGLEDAKARAARGNLANVFFQRASILDLPFGDATFDLVWCAGVLMITADEERALDELLRVVKPGGKLYLLVYASGGLRWPLIQLLRPAAAQLGQARFEAAIERAGLPANKRRTFLDDLFCPALDFYHWERLERMLRQRGVVAMERWGTQARLDHEASLADYADDLAALEQLYAAGLGQEPGLADELFAQGHAQVAATVATVRSFEAEVGKGALAEEAAMSLVVGQGHHRVLATKG